MKRAAVIASVAALCQPICAQAAEGETRILAPSSSWTLDFAAERCSLVSEFGEGDDKVRLQIDSFGASSRGYRVMISGKLVPGSDAPPMPDFRVSYSPDTRERERFTVLAGKFGEDNAVSFRQGFLPAGPSASRAPLMPQLASGSRQASDPRGTEFERNITHMTVEFGSDTSFRLDTGSMAAPFAAIHQCVDDLIASWGIDPAVHRTLTRWVQLAGLPQDQIRLKPTRNGRPGYTERGLRSIVDGTLSTGELVPSRLMIDAAGKPTACVVQSDSENEASRRAICESFKGYSFEPALDAARQPVASFILFETR